MFYNFVWTCFIKQKLWYLILSILPILCFALLLVVGVVPQWTWGFRTNTYILNYYINYYYRAF